MAQCTNSTFIQHLIHNHQKDFIYSVVWNRNKFKSSIHKTYFKRTLNANYDPVDFGKKYFRVQTVNRANLSHNILILYIANTKNRQFSGCQTKVILKEPVYFR